MTGDVHGSSENLAPWAMGVFMNALTNTRKEKAHASGLHKKLLALLSKEGEKNESAVTDPMVPAFDQRAILAKQRFAKLSSAEQNERQMHESLREARTAMMRSERFMRGQAALLSGKTRKEFLRDVETIVRDAWLHAPEKITHRDFKDYRTAGIPGDGARRRADLFLTRLALKVSNKELRHELYLREASRVFYEHARTRVLRHARDVEEARIRAETPGVLSRNVGMRARFAAVIQGVVTERGHQWNDRVADWGREEQSITEHVWDIYRRLPASTQTSFGIHTAVASAFASAPTGTSGDEGVLSFGALWSGPARIGALVEGLAKQQRVAPSLAVHLGSRGVSEEVHEKMVREMGRGRTHRAIGAYAEVRSSLARRIIGTEAWGLVVRGASLIVKGFVVRPESTFSLEGFAASLPTYELAIAKVPHDHSDEPIARVTKGAAHASPKSQHPQSPYSERVPEGFQGVRAFERLAERELLSHFGEEFASLSAIGKNFLIGFLREQATARPPDFGIRGVEKLALGDIVDFAIMKKNADFAERLGEHFELSKEAGRLTQNEVDILEKMGFNPDEYVNPDYLNIIRNVSVLEFLRRFPTAPGAPTPEALGPRIFGPAGSQVVWESMSHHARFADFVRRIFERHTDAGNMALKDFLTAYGS